MRALDDWLVEEANLRGHFGALGGAPMNRRPTQELSDEALIVAVLMPHTPADGRLFKLVVRMMQRSQLDAARLWLIAKREQADGLLFWLLQQVPAQEKTESLHAIIASHPNAPRNLHPLRYEYDATRLLRRPATKESVCKAARRSS